MPRKRIQCKNCK